MAEVTLNPIVDGVVTNSGSVGAPWSEVRNAATGNAVYNTSTNELYADAGDVTGQPVYVCARGFFLFDTSVIGASGTVTAGTLSVYPTAKSDTDTAGSINIYDATPAGTTSLTTADYDQVGTVAYSSAVDLTGMGTGSYLDFALNAAALAAINVSGVSKFGMREVTHDVAGTTPGSNAREYAQGNFVENATNKPKLVLTYTPPPGGKLNLTSKYW